MQRLFNLVILAISSVVLANCTSTSGLNNTQQTDQLGADANAQYYDTRSSAVTSPYTDGSGINSGVAGSDRIIYFAFDSYDINSAYRPIVEAQAQLLIANPGSQVVLEGHADELGTREYNIGLGDRRSESVRRLLIALGVPSQQIRSVSYGEERPAATGQDENSYQLNRRVEFVY